MDMPLNGYFPKRGDVLLCDFSRGFVPPEIVKAGRPVVVISDSMRHSQRLCTVVPLSTVAPRPMQAWHHKMDINHIPTVLSGKDSWAKCDMLYTVSFDRLDKPHTKARAGRTYFVPVLSEIELAQVIACVKAYLNFPND